MTNKTETPINLSGNKYKCILSLKIGTQEIFTKGMTYISDRKGCLTNNYRVNTIVISNYFDFHKYFELK